MILAVITLAFANFMVVLDMTIANVSVPNIAAWPGRVAQRGHLGDHLLRGGRGDHRASHRMAGLRFGAAKVFVTRIGLFGLCSPLCGLAPSLNILICRILQGLSGGPMMPMSQTLLQRLVPPRLRAQTMGLWAMTTLVAPIMGPVLGGTISDTFGWSGVLHQRAGGRAAGDLALVHPAAARVHPAPAGRRHRPRPADHMGRGAADHARQGRGAGLVQLPHRHRPPDRRYRRLPGLP